MTAKSINIYNTRRAWPQFISRSHWGGYFQKEGANFEWVRERERKRDQKGLWGQLIIQMKWKSEKITIELRTVLFKVRLIKETTFSLASPFWHLYQEWTNKSTKMPTLFIFNYYYYKLSMRYERMPIRFTSGQGQLTFEQGLLTQLFTEGQQAQVTRARLAEFSVDSFESP